MKKLLLIICFNSFFSKCFSQQFSLLKDINPGSASSNTCFLTHVDHLTFFAASNGINGMELWKTDGTETGTVMIKDIRPGSANSSIGYLTQVNHTLFFVANNGITGTELWKSDGTTEGTVLVKDIRTGLLGSNPSGLVNYNDLLYFAADDGINGIELWKSDGTTNGTVLVKDINPFSAGSYPQSFANVNGSLFFAADNGTKGMELWKSDGTTNGTVLVKDIWAGITGSYPYGLVGVGSTLFFAATNGINGNELWKSNGTAAGTVLIRDIWPGSGDSYPYSFKSINGELFFSANNGINGEELWKTNGTSEGTVLIKDIWPGEQSGTAGNFSSFFNRLLFTGNDGIGGYKTWESDGTESGTIISTMSSAGDLMELLETNDNIFASIGQNEIGRELWSVNYNSVLPLNILEFNGWLTGKDAVINWKTNHEINTSEFIVERSFDGTSFSPVGKVKSANTPGIHNYSFTDFHILFSGGLIYYRIKQKDNDHHITYSKVISLTVPAVADKAFFSIYPNPATNQFNISITARQRGNMNYLVFDNTGKKIIQQSTRVIVGQNNIPVDIRNLSAGMYYTKLSNGTLSEVIQFVKR